MNKYLLALFFALCVQNVNAEVTPITLPAVSPSSAAATYVNKAGDTMTGALTTSGLTPQAGMGLTTGRLAVQTKSNTIGSGGINLGVGVCGIQPTASDDIMFWVYNGADTEVMRIKNSNASVGIGTASPASKLHMSSGTFTVDGNDATSLRLDGSAGGCIMLQDTDEAGWTECDALNGVLSCSTDADGICD